MYVKYIILVVIIWFPLVSQCLFLHCPEAISAIPHLGSIHLSFPSTPAPRLLCTAGKMDKTFPVDSITGK